MRMFDVQGIGVPMAPSRKVFEFLRDPANLPSWPHPACQRWVTPVSSRQAERLTSV